MFLMMFSTGGRNSDQDNQEVRQLVELALAGRQDAFEDLVFRYREQVYATARQLT